MTAVWPSRTPHRDVGLQSSTIQIHQRPPDTPLRNCFQGIGMHDGVFIPQAAQLNPRAEDEHGIGLAHSEAP